MANLVVTFTRASPDKSHEQYFPVEYGKHARTEQIVIGAESTAGNLEATGADFVVRLTARADCWVSIGGTPVAAVGQGRFMQSGELTWYYAESGDKVAAIADA